MSASAPFYPRGAAILFGAGRDSSVRLEGTVRSACRNHLLLAILIAGTASGCAGSRPELTVAASPLPFSSGMVFAVDGAGGWDVASNTLRQVVAEAGLPLTVETYQWQHGHGRIIADQCDCAYARAAGERLAEKVCAYRKDCPGNRVYLFAHSAGSQVALAAAEALPPNSIDRIILLAPSVSACYDLRPALRTSCQGIDTFYSHRDWWYLGFGVSVTGTADRRWSAAAGRVGFRPITSTPEDACLYAKLRQYEWQPDTGLDRPHRRPLWRASTRPSPHLGVADADLRAALRQQATSQKK